MPAGCHWRKMLPSLVFADRASWNSLTRDEAPPSNTWRFHSGLINAAATLAGGAESQPQLSQAMRLSGKDIGQTHMPLLIKRC